ncbi:MAG TPA: hypothetical protein DCY35_03675 [Prolixibacteraceae bacterium]|nr:hypothetical protein [Prolixibacteraceae bacterium]
MKLSIFTPTHNTQYLPELEDSIMANIYLNWEWVILLNNGAEYESNDPRIKIFRSESGSTSVGALKKEACALATGDILIEVDHDDLITPDCLEEIYKAFDDKSVGFAYSDNAKLADNFTPYSPEYGWRWSYFDYQDRKIIRMHSLPLTPGRLGYIWYAPDHVRAWRKSVYDQVGGHNGSLEICDDQELMHRTYLATKFRHIDKVLYLYRITGENTWLQRNQAIQIKTVEIYKQNILALSEKWSADNKLLKIDLCGAFSKPKGYLSVDLQDADIIADLNDGIPLPDGSCGIVRAFDALEHLVDKQKTMSEIHRVLAPGGMLFSMTPSTDGRGAWQDPTHVSFWNENSFWYWTRPEQMKYIRNTAVKFYEGILSTVFPSEWHKMNNIPYVQAVLEKVHN